MARPFVFGMQFMKLPADWRATIARYESLGIGRFTFHDHFFAAQEGPMAGLGAIAGAAASAGVETNVLDLNYWNPAVVAREAATLAALAPGGCDLGVGAGWNPVDAAVAGVAFPPAAERLGRLREFAEVLRQLWTAPGEGYTGTYYSQGSAPGFDVDPARRPRLLIGATRAKALALAGELADVVSVYATISGTLDWPAWAADSGPESFARKTGLALDAARAAGREVGGIDLHTVTSFVGVADDPVPLQQRITAATGLDAGVMRGSFMFLTGTYAEAREALLARREATGINYYVFQPFQVPDEAAFAAFAEQVLAPLAGS